MRDLGLHSTMSNFAKNGWKTYGSFTFAVPGGRDEDRCQASVVKVLLDVDVKHLASSLSGVLSSLPPLQSPTSAGAHKKTLGI